MNEQQRIANEIFKSIDIITDKKIQDASFSMSITGRIVERIKGSDMYKVNYQNEEIRALSMGAAYDQGDTVIILVPDKRMDSLKFILGRANDRTPTISVSQTGGLSPALLAEIQAALNNIADITSDNVISPSEKQALSVQWLQVQSGYNQLLTSLRDYIAEIDPAIYNARYDQLREYMNTILADMNSSSNINGSAVNEAFALYYKEEQDIRMQILDVIRDEVSYKSEIISSNGVAFKNGVINTMLEARVYRGKKDISETLPVTAYVWKKVSSNGIVDEEWGQNHQNVGRFLALTVDDVYEKATFFCDIQID